MFTGEFPIGPTADLKTAFEETPRLKIALVGCGPHSYRSIFPCFDYLPVELVATCDLDLARAQTYARKFGAQVACGSLEEVAARGDVDAVILTVGPRQYPDLACQALEAGMHVWMEKPPAMNVAEVDRMIAARDKAGKNVVVGLKKAFMPGGDRMKSLLESGDFGQLRTVQGRFPLDCPANGAEVLENGDYVDWLKNGVHALSFMVYMAGRPDRVTMHRSRLGGGFCVLEHPNGAVGNLHLAYGHSRSGAMERYEAVAEMGHIILENNARLTVHRPGYPLDYRKGYDFTAGAADVAALVYEPQWTLSTLENKAIFIEGFVQELEHFVASCLSGQKPQKGTLEFARVVMECYEAGLLSENGKPVCLDDLPSNRNREAR